MNRPKIVMIIAVVLAFVWLPSAHAQHEAGGEANAPQNLVNHADGAIVAGAAAVQVLAENPARVTASCQNRDATGNDVVVGDASTDATHGARIAATQTAKLDITGPVFVFSALGSSAFGCQEIVRP